MSDSKKLTTNAGCPVAASYFPHTDVFVPLLAFSSISIPMNMVFAFILGHTLPDTEASAKPVEA